MDGTPRQTILDQLTRIGPFVPPTYGGYSSAEMQQRQLSAAYANLLRQQQFQQQNWAAAGIATAVGIDPSGKRVLYYPPSSPVEAKATVVTEVKSTPCDLAGCSCTRAMRRARYWRGVRYWTLLASLSIISIWPAWSSFLRSPKFWGTHDQWSYGPQMLPIAFVLFVIAWFWFSCKVLVDEIRK